MNVRTVRKLLDAFDDDAELVIFANGNLYPVLVVADCENVSDKKTVQLGCGYADLDTIREFENVDY